MNKFVVPAVVVLFASVSAHATPADDVAAAVRNLAAAANYSWTATDAFVRGASPAAVMVTESATEKDGFTVTKKTYNTGARATRDDIVYRGAQMAYFRAGSWKTSEELRAETGGSAGVMVTQNGPSGMSVQVIDAPTDENAANDADRPAEMALRLLDQVKTVTPAGDAFVGELPYEFIAKRLRFIGRNGAETLSRNASGSVTFWISNGIIAKYQIQLKGAFENPAMPGCQRTTTTEIKNVGTSVVAVPAAAKAKFEL